jgi:hypothetical protein
MLCDRHAHPSAPAHTRPCAPQQSQKGGETVDNANGNVANDFYHRWQGDVAMMKKLGVKTYRLVCVRKLRSWGVGKHSKGVCAC